MTQADLIIIGGGPGGYETAVSAANAGLNTVLVEAERLGGACLNEGCIPTKCLCRTAEIIDLLNDSAQYGIECRNVTFNIQKAQERKNKVIEELHSGISKLLELAKVRIVYGRAEFVCKNEIRVIRDSSEGTLSEEYTAKHIIIATGAKTCCLPVPGYNLLGVVTSKDLLSIETIPDSICIIGGGVIGVEFASIFSSFGSKVTVIEYRKEILPNFDSELSKRLRLILKRKGVVFYTNSSVTNISKPDVQRLSVGYTAKGVDSTTEADVVLMAVGRSANMESINLDDIGIATDKRGIVVDENFRTNVDGIYAIGDVNGICQLAHAAKYQGKRALNNILGKPDSFNFDVIPAAVFTQPEFSMVGKTEDACIADGIEYITRKVLFRANGKALALGSTEGLAKMILSPSGKILGCHILGPHASDLIEEVAVVMQQGGTCADIYQTIHAHPTLCEVVCDVASE